MPRKPSGRYGPIARLTARWLRLLAPARHGFLQLAAKGPSTSSPPISTCNNRELAATSPPDPLQNNGLTAADAFCGNIAFFRLSLTTPSSMVHTNGFINTGASDHPVIILGTPDDGDTVWCCLATSFGGQSLGTKFPASRQQGMAGNKVHWHYAALGHGPATEVHPCGLPVLQLEDGELMDKPIYVDLYNAFRIETRYLAPFHRGAHHLDSASVAAFRSVFRALRDRRIPRVEGRTDPWTGTAEQFTWSQMGIPDGQVWSPPFSPLPARMRTAPTSRALQASSWRTLSPVAAC
jgi:hypothetical protein